MNKHLIKGFFLAAIVAVTTAGIINHRRKCVLDKVKLIEYDISKNIKKLKKHGIYIQDDNWQIIDISEYSISNTNLKRISVLIEANDGLFFEYNADFNIATYKKLIDTKPIKFTNPISKSYMKKASVSSLSEWEYLKQFGV